MTTIRILKGFKSADFSKRVPIYVAFTSDKIGETLSVGSGKNMYTLKYKPIEEMVKRERGYKYKNGHYIIDATEDYIPVEFMRKYIKETTAECSAEDLIEQMVKDYGEEIRQEFENEVKKEE